LAAPGAFSFRDGRFPRPPFSTVNRRAGPQMPLRLDRLADRVTFAHDRAAMKYLRARHVKAAGAWVAEVPDLIRAECDRLFLRRAGRGLVTRLIGHFTTRPPEPPSLFGADSIFPSELSPSKQWS